MSWSGARSTNSLTFVCCDVVLRTRVTTWSLILQSRWWSSCLLTNRR